MRNTIGKKHTYEQTDILSSSNYPDHMIKKSNKKELMNKN